ncbi:RNA polymerase sigma factor [Luteimonas lutimaris]|uniref:RNA polymerase sigma factor n=1 Tax=Luteimonas lutimaris TaxID=698645 RepID=A0ABP7MX08_9GAMM|nr:sigma-70 family RNA polymerase sigma factor [Luteimonas sp.]
MNAEAIDLLVRTELPAAARGDRDAYGRVVAACQNTVTAVALAITRDVPASEDIAQDAFLAAWQNLKRLQNPASFLPWLRQITRNLARDHLRANRHRPLDGEGAEIAISLAADTSPTPAEQLVEDEREQAAAELIAALPDDSREVLLLYYREGQSSRQVSALLGLSDAAVRKRLSRARQGLREDLLKRFGEFARSSAPTAAFTAIISTALATASPPAAAKGILAVAAAGGAKTAGKVLLGAAGSIGIGIAAALAGIWLGLRSQLKGAIDERERSELVRSAVINSLASIGFVILLVLVASSTHGLLRTIAAVALTLGFMAVIVYQSLVVQPRALRRRHAMEAARDPVAAAKRRRRERINCWIGFIIGITCGLGGLIVGLMSTGNHP